MNGINLHIYPSTIEFESRMMRMTSAVAEAGLFERIDLVGVWEPGLPEVEEIDDSRRIIRIKTNAQLTGLGAIGRILQLVDWNRKIARRYKNETVRLINPHIVWGLPVASWLKRRCGCRVIYDTHELETETIASRGLRKRLSQLIERRYIHHADATHVVSTGIENWYRQKYSLKNLHTIKNYPLRRDSLPPSRIFRDKFDIADTDLVFCYQGRLSRVDEIEMLLKVFRRVQKDRHLVFMGFGPLAERLAKLGAKTPNIHFHAGVPFDEVPAHTGSADVALVLFEDACLSYHHVLPNKLLESLSAGVPVIVSDLPEMVAEISRDQAGWVVHNDVETIARLINQLDLDQIAACRTGALNWSQAHYWALEAERMLDIYRKVLNH